MTSSLTHYLDCGCSAESIEAQRAAWSLHLDLPPSRTSRPVAERIWKRFRQLGNLHLYTESSIKEEPPWVDIKYVVLLCSDCLQELGAVERGGGGRRSWWRRS